MARRTLILGLTAMMIVALVVSISSVSSAQPPGAPAAPYCIDNQLKEWYVWGTPDTEMWWFYWVYDWCYQSNLGWYKAYSYWDWWGPVG